MTDKAIKIIHHNKKASHDYQLLEKLEVGMVLTGSEIKSIRGGSCNLKDAYVLIERGELYLHKAHISTYKESTHNNHAPERKRKLLAHKIEIERLDRKATASGLTIVATKIYLKNGRAKLEIALAKGKKAHDKRAAIKKRDVGREISQTLRKNR
ncbi:MAG: SsrA-binding protein SmpB [Bdellovibrionales bacterium]|nr:SsrA-binding protein SmpB [Bdellovibrionales bacterium]